MKISFSIEAWNDYLFWQKQDKKTFNRLNVLIKDISKNPFYGIGKPEPLKHHLSGFWSRRIDIENRLIYQFIENEILIISCRYHYK